MVTETTSQILSDDELAAPELTTYFYISGWDFDPGKCTLTIGLEPSEIWKQKHKHLLDRRDVPNTSWNLGKQKQRKYSVSEAVDEVLDLSWPKRKEIIRLSRDKSFNVGVTCSITIYDDRPVYDLSLKTIKRLADLGCEFSLDIFDYSTGDE